MSHSPRPLEQEPATAHLSAYALSVARGTGDEQAQQIAGRALMYGKRRLPKQAEPPSAEELAALIEQARAGDLNPALAVLRRFPAERKLLAPLLAVLRELAHMHARELETQLMLTEVVSKGEPGRGEKLVEDELIALAARWRRGQSYSDGVLQVALRARLRSLNSADYSLVANRIDRLEELGARLGWGGRRDAWDAIIARELAADPELRELIARGVIRGALEQPAADDKPDTSRLGRLRQLHEQLGLLDPNGQIIMLDGQLHLRSSAGAPETCCGRSLVGHASEETFPGVWTRQPDQHCASCELAEPSIAETKVSPYVTALDPAAERRALEAGLPRVERNIEELVREKALPDLDTVTESELVARSPQLVSPFSRAADAMMVEWIPAIADETAGLLLERYGNGAAAWEALGVTLYADFDPVTRGELAGVFKRIIQMGHASDVRQLLVIEANTLGVRRRRSVER